MLFFKDSESILPDYKPCLDNFLLENTDDILMTPQNDEIHKPVYNRTISRQYSHSKNVNNDDQEDDLLIELESDPETETTNIITTETKPQCKKVNPFSPSTICPR